MSPCRPVMDSEALRPAKAFGVYVGPIGRRLGGDRLDPADPFGITNPFNDCSHAFRVPNNPDAGEASEAHQPVRTSQNGARLCTVGGSSRAPSLMPDEADVFMRAMSIGPCGTQRTQGRVPAFAARANWQAYRGSRSCGCPRPSPSTTPDDSTNAVRDWEDRCESQLNDYGSRSRSRDNMVS